MQQENHEPYVNEAAGEEHVLALGDRDDLHLGDYVGFERITANRDWRLALGKVVGFPCARFVKVAYYDPVNRETVAQDPISEEVIRKKAEEEGRLQLWHDREALHEELTAALENEKEATKGLFAARDATLAKQAAVADMTKDAVKQLPGSRKSVKKVPARQWRDLRTGGEPNESVVRLFRAVMLVLYEDRATSWDTMEPILKDKNFLDRLLGWDCSMTPMSRPRRRKIVALCAGEDLGASAVGATGRRGSRGSNRHSNNSTPHARNEPAATVEEHGSDVGTFAQLDAALRMWLNAQLACSEAAEAQERAIDECFAEQQEQRVELRKVNEMRVNISRIEVMMQESKCAIMGTDPNPNPIMPLEQYPIDTIFYKRTYPDSEGRFVQEVILRDAVLVNYGPLANEDTEGYVRLSKEQADILRTTIHQAYIKHDADEMQDLLARKEREEEEIAQLRERIEHLRSRPTLTDEEIEELGQLEKLVEDAERRHRATLNRIAELYACGRGAREITMASKRIDAKFTRLHCKMSGDWEEILNDPERLSEMKEALRDDICALLHIPRDSVFDIDARSGSLLIDFTVKHNGELDDEELQDLVNNADFSALSLFYEKVTFKKTCPLNTPAQEAKYEEEMHLLEQSRKREFFSGIGIREKLEDYYNADGTLDEEFGEEITGDVDYRKAIITIPPVREEYEEYAATGPIDRYCADDEDEEGVLAPAPAADEGDDGDEEMDGADEPGALLRTAPLTEDTAQTTHTAAYGLTNTQDVAEEEEKEEEEAAAAASEHSAPPAASASASRRSSSSSSVGIAASSNNSNSNKNNNNNNSNSSSGKRRASAASSTSSHRTPQEQEAPQPQQRSVSIGSSQDEL